MDMEALKPVLALVTRHALTATGAYMGLTGEDQTKFIGAGMVLAGLAWSWWQKRGQALVAAELAKLKGAK